MLRLAHPPPSLSKWENRVDFSPSIFKFVRTDRKKPAARRSGIATRGSGIATQGSGVTAQGSGIATQGPGIAAQGPGIAAQGPGIAAQGSGIATQGPGIAAQGSGIVTQDPGIVTQDPGIVTQGSGIATRPYSPRPPYGEAARPPLLLHEIFFGSVDLPGDRRRRRQPLGHPVGGAGLGRDGHRGGAHVSAGDADDLVELADPLGALPVVAVHRGSREDPRGGARHETQDDAGDPGHHPQQNPRR